MNERNEIIIIRTHTHSINSKGTLINSTSNELI
jgi:hypothetical protein